MTRDRDLTLELPVSQLVLRGRRWSGGEGQRLTLCTHGWLDNCNSFAPLAAALEDRELLAIDLPGHGRSDHLPPAAHYHTRALAGYLIELIETQDWRDIDLLGHCNGGVVFLLVAAALPERVRRVVLIDVIHPDLASDDELCESAIRHYRSRTRAVYETHPVYPDRTQVFQLRRRGSDMLYATAETLTERDLLETAEGFTLRMDPRLRRPFYVCFDEGLFGAYLRRVRAPVLYIASQRPPQPDDARKQRQVDMVERIRVERIAGGHYLHMENVLPVAEAIASFLDAAV